MKEFVRGLFSQGIVVHALILRETRTRFGAHNLGYLWALLEPVLLILTFWGFFSVMGRTAPFDMDLFGFITTGVVPYVLFSSSWGRVAEAISGNRALLFYPQVQPLDLAIARALLELVTYSAVFLVLMGANALHSQELAIKDPLLVIIGYVTASALGSSLGLVFCALGQLSKVADRARGPLLRPLFWVSGVFFAADSLPDSVRDIMLMNPVLHTVEIVRGGWFPTYPAAHSSIQYPWVWILVFSVVGLSLERVVRRRIELT